MLNAEPFDAVSRLPAPGIRTDGDRRPGTPCGGEVHDKKSDRASIANAFLWAAAILASAVVLRGTPCVTPMIVILGGTQGVSNLLVESVFRKR